MPSKRLLHAALLSSAAFLIAAPAFATPFTIPANTTLNAQEKLKNDEAGVIATGATLTNTKKTINWSGGTTSPGSSIDNSGTITSGGRAIDSDDNITTGSISITNHTNASIISTGADTVRIDSNVTNGTILLTNGGLIEAQGVGDVNGQAIDFDALQSSTAVVHIINQANGVISAADSDAIRAGTSTLDNYGTIVSHYSPADNANGNDSGNDAIDFQDVNAGTVNNYLGGSITGARHGITGKNPLTISNDGAITGLDGSGINLDTANTSLTHVTNTSHGVITGNAVDGDGDGVDVDGLIAIDNYGQVKGLGQHAGETSEAFAIGGGTVNNYAGGMIEGVDRAITVDDSNLGNAYGATTITNDGTIQGDTGDAIKITSCVGNQNCFSNTLTNRGTIIGNVALGGGNDTLNLGYGSSITGTVDGQGGNDAVHLADAGAVSNIVNFETLSADSGTSALKGTQTYSGGVTVQSGATLGMAGATLNASVTNHGTVKVIGASATFNGNFVNSGTFISDPTTVHFATFQNDASGIVKAAPGDVYQVTGDFLNFSTQNTAWTTNGAILEFMGGTDHELRINGTDLGTGPAGFVNNFAWGGLKIDSGDTLSLAGLDDAVFYAGAIIGADIAGNAIDNITGALDIYYNAADAANAYLGGLTYDLQGGGKLIAAAAPEPATLFIAAPALAIFLRRKARKSVHA